MRIWVFQHIFFHLSQPTQLTRGNIWGNNTAVFVNNYKTFNPKQPFKKLYFFKCGNIAPPPDADKTSYGFPEKFPHTSFFFIDNSTETKIFQLWRESFSLNVSWKSQGVFMFPGISIVFNSKIFLSLHYVIKCLSMNTRTSSFCQYCQSSHCHSS